MPEEKSRLVFSTDKRIPRKECTDEKIQSAGLVPAELKVTIHLERKGRGGKSVTVIDGLKISHNEKDALLKKLKKSLGTGGTMKDTTLEIQGDYCTKLMAILEKMGFRPKRSGG